MAPCEPLQRHSEEVLLCSVPFNPVLTVLSSCGAEHVSPSLAYCLASLPTDGKTGIRDWQHNFWSKVDSSSCLTPLPLITYSIICTKHDNVYTNWHHDNNLVSPKYISKVIYACIYVFQKTIYKTVHKDQLCMCTDQVVFVLFWQILCQQASTVVCQPHDLCRGERRCYSTAICWLLDVSGYQRLTMGVRHMIL